MIYSYKNRIINHKNHKYSEFVGYGYFDENNEFIEKIRKEN